MITIGSTLVLETYDTNQPSQTVRYRSKVIEKSSEALFIDYPVNEQTKRTDIFPIGTIFKASYVGDDEAVYTFRTSLTGREMLKVPALVLHLPEQKEWRRIQRRQYVRIETVSDLAVHAADKSFAPFTSVTKDLSGGGLSFVLPSDHRVKEGKEATLFLSLPKKDSNPSFLELKARVVRIHTKSGSRKELASVQFTDISDKDRQYIIRHCFEIQRSMRKKGIK